MTQAGLLKHNFSRSNPASFQVQATGTSPSNCENHYSTMCSPKLPKLKGSHPIFVSCELVNLRAALGPTFFGVFTEADMVNS